MLNNMFDRAVFARCIPAFKDDQNFFIVLYEMSLQLDKLNLKFVQAVLVDFARFSRRGLAQIVCTDFPAHD